MTWKWGEVKDRIEELYITQDMSLDNVILTLKREYGFAAKKRTYQKRLRGWKIYKRPCNNSKVLRSEQAPSRQAPVFDLEDLLFTSISPSDGGDSAIQSDFLVHSTSTQSCPQVLAQLSDDPGLGLVASELMGGISGIPFDTASYPLVGLVVGNKSTPQSEEDHCIGVTISTPRGERGASYLASGSTSCLATGLGLMSPAIEVAHAYITACEISISEYIELHRKISEEYIQKPGNSFNTEGYKEFVTVEISLRNLTDHHRFLLFCSFLDGKQIPLELVRRLMNHSQTSIDRCVLELLQYRLISQVCLKSISISPTTQEWMQKRLPSYEHSLNTEREVIMKMSDSIFLDYTSSKEDCQFAQQAIPHVKAVIGLILRHDSEAFWDEALLKAAAGIADVARRLEINDKAILVLEHIRRLMECRIGKQHPRTLDTMNTLSVTYISTKKWLEAEHLLRTLVDSRRDSVNRNEFCYLTELGNLIRVLVKLGHVEEARRLQTAVSDCVKRLAPQSHRERIRIEMKLGESFRLCGYLPEAEGHFSRLHKETTAILGKNHPNTLRVLEFLCHVHFDQKSWAHAERLGLELIELSKKALGEGQIDTVRRIGFLEKVYQKKGEWRD